VKEAAQAKKKATRDNKFPKDTPIIDAEFTEDGNALILYVLTEGRRFELHMKEMLPC
jgi:hypothetical protein